MVKLTVLYGQPKSPEDFEKYYADVHTPLAQRMEGLRRFEVGKVTGTPDGKSPPYYRFAGLYFDDMAQLQSTMGSQAGRDTAADLANFATGGVTLMISEVQDVPSS
jgi:uncharacterized protein (TIGR02118 family)